VSCPRLRDRRSDIPLLVDHFIERFRERLKVDVTGVSEAAMAQLLGHPWPGNIRELENVIERCLLFCDGATIEVGDLPPELQASTPAALPAEAATPPPGAVATPQLEGKGEPTGLKEAVKEATVRLERELIVRALAQTGGNVTHTARRLKISRKSLQTKMKELGLREES
jgi:two-component system response regulator AtoC